MAFDPGVAALGVTTQWDDLISALVAGDQNLIALVKGHIATESQWNPGAVNPADPSYGLMQILAGPRGRYPTVPAADLLDPSTNITLGTNFLLELIRQYGVPAASAAYNAGHPMYNSAGQFVNSQGSTRVQAYVDEVLTYQDYYLRQMALPTSGQTGTSLADIVRSAIQTVAPTDATQPTDTTTPADATPPVDTTSLTEWLGAGLAIGGLALAIGYVMTRRTA